MSKSALGSHRTENLAPELFRTDFSGELECFVKNGKAFDSTKSHILKFIVPAIGKPIYADKESDEQSDEQPAEQPDNSPDVYS